MGDGTHSSGRMSTGSAILANFTFLAKRSSCRVRMPHQFMSTSYQARPWRAEVGCAWWLLCQPSPKVKSATHQLLRESSVVTKRRLPHKWVAEFTSQVECSPTTTRKKTPHRTKGHPPRA